VESFRTRERLDIVFVLPHMGRGGAQRVASIVANAWAEKGKRVCIVTWDSTKEEAHTLNPNILRIDMSDFTRELLREPTWRRARLIIQHRLRETERWMRSRWPWRRWSLRKWKLAQFKGEGSSRKFPEWLPWWSSSRIRRLVARVALSLDRHKGNSTALSSPLVKSSLARLVLGYRIDIFRELFIQLQAPVIMSLLTKTNLYVLAAAEGLNVRVVVSERNDPDLQKIGFDLASLRALSYRNAHAVTSNSLGVLEKMSAFVPSDRLRLLPNPIIVPGKVDLEDGKKTRFITVARLVHQKGVDLLLDAFARVADDLEDWSLEIVGDGPLMDTLRTQAESLGISARVTFHGHIADPLPVMRKCRIFVLPSRFEGMPNALLEAMSCGLAPIVSNASPGPLETIRHAESGLIFPTEDSIALADAMRKLALDDMLWARVSAASQVYIKEHEWPSVEAQWLDVLGVSR
jgi:glycosyltransferase involved in cell wall biosynthesis